MLVSCLWQWIKNDKCLSEKGPPFRKGSTMQSKGLLVGAIIAAFIAVTIGGLWLSAHNQEVSLRNKGRAQQRNLENMFDKTWKIISQQAQISEEAREAFKEIYPALMEGRYGNARGRSE